MRRFVAGVVMAVVAGGAPPALAAPSKAGRPEALIVATTFGFYQGIATTLLLKDADVLNDEDDVVFAGAGLTLASTAGTYWVASAVTERYGVNQAQASMFNASLFWAVLNGTGGALAADARTDRLLWSTLVSGWTGQAIGILSAAHVDRTAGQVGLMSTAGTWFGAETLVVMTAAGARDGYALAGTLAVDAGLVTGYALASTSIGRGVSQTRARWLDLGALAGGLAAPAALFMVWGPEEDLRAWYLSAVAVGIPLGLGTAWYLTRDLDADDPTPDAGGDAPLMLPLTAGVF